MKKEEEPNSSNDPKNTMEAFVRRFDNFYNKTMSDGSVWGQGW